ncbi:MULTISPECIES: GDSL-type esterase/lipase family protein [Desulfosediminicola]|uniref:GDSL-type esterase/lipase family protein n=1 Tax=Desulfosediminicola TaxID=2886823 RepID=UPI0010ABD603|nr:GDSL-type esterase/lipase family protein [Desulfosediminicola ganghwensis]
MSATPPRNNNVKPPFLMIGDSLVAGFDWQNRLPAFEVLNFGIPGFTTGELLTSLPQIQKKCSSPKLILVMIGTNDFLMGNHDFTEDLKKIVVWLSNSYPAAETMVNSLLPIRCPHDHEAIIEINRIIAGICRDTASCYIDVYSRFTKSDIELFETDGVHLTDAGYELWTRTLFEYVAFLMEND